MRLAARNLHCPDRVLVYEDGLQVGKRIPRTSMVPVARRIRNRCRADVTKRTGRWGCCAKVSNPAFP